MKRVRHVVSVLTIAAWCLALWVVFVDPVREVDQLLRVLVVMGAFFSTANIVAEWLAVIRGRAR